MTAARRLGIAGFLLSVGAACTQLFGTDRENTLAPRPAPSFERAPLNPAASALPAPEGVCRAGQFQCNGALLQTCADDLTSWITVQRCAAAALCQLDPALCLAASCGPDEMTCAGALLQKCNADRTGWDDFATCASPAHCNADRRSCLPAPCSPGDRRCDRSDLDQSPVLETCQADQQDWQLLDTCVTRELCAQTLTDAQAGGLTLSSDGIPQLQGPTDTNQVTSCLLPACALGEVRCDGSRLEYCSEGRTGFVTAEECASSALCQGSLMNFTPAGVPACLPPVCAENEHQCTEAGVLQVCTEDRTGFRVIQSCIGPPFCNAALADQGQDGCRSAPCEAGQMQCNGAQIQICRQDRTALDSSGPLCESAALCNAEDPTYAFCETPLCRRGSTSGNEFRCEGNQLQRCNELLTGYDTVASCVTAALCDAAQRQDGCQPPVCQPRDHACREGFLQQCNADQTGFDNIENCGSQGACDANAGRCADPCQPGAVRCNNQSGDLEECRDPLIGWQTIGDCVSGPLCDAQNRTCRDPICPQAGQRRCETRGQSPVVTECSVGRDAFNVVRTCTQGQICDAQNNECDVCQPNSRRCEGNTLVVCDARGQSEQRTTCAAGCATVAGQTRCLACGPDGSARCSDRQLFVCQQGATGEFEQSEFCETDELCNQTLQTCGRGLNGQSCQCTPGACRPNQLRCFGNALQRCNAGLTDFDFVTNCGQGLCNAATGDCNTCVGNEFSCNNGQLRQCAADGRSFARQNIGVECASASQVRVCNGNAAGVQNCPNGCTNGRGCNQCTGNGVQCVNGNTIRRCVNGFFQDQTCQFGCNAGSQQCNACQGSGTTCSNGNTQQQCVNGQFANTNCPLGCVAGRCANCNTGQCNNNQFRACNNGQLANAVTCQDPANPCIGPSCNPQTGCGQANLTGNSCSDGNACNGNETCQNGACNNPPDVQCPAPPACRTVACNPQNGQCTQSNVPDGTGCGGGSTCQNGACIAPDPCATTNCNAVLPAASRPCSTGTRCVSGNGIAVCQAIPAPAGTSCDPPAGIGRCDGAGSGAQNCVVQADQCTNFDCSIAGSAGSCIVSTCTIDFLTGNPRCLRLIAAAGTGCIDLEGARGSCNGTGMGPAACTPR